MTDKKIPRSLTRGKIWPIARRRAPAAVAFRPVTSRQQRERPVRNHRARLRHGPLGRPVPCHGVRAARRVVPRPLCATTRRCALQQVGVDLTDPARRGALFTEVGGAARRVLVVSEGLLVYLTRDQVAALAGDLAAQPSFAWWLIDLASPGLLKMLEKTWGRAVAGNAPFQFAPPEGTQFFQPLGWCEAEFRSTWDESLRLKRTMRLAWLGRLLPRLYPKKKREEFRRFSGIVLFKRC